MRQAKGRDRQVTTRVLCNLIDIFEALINAFDLIPVGTGGLRIHYVAGLLLAHTEICGVGPKRAWNIVKSGPTLNPSQLILQINSRL